jgi:hypothetical protein
MPLYKLILICLEMFFICYGLKEIDWVTWVDALRTTSRNGEGTKISQIIFLGPIL